MRTFNICLKKRAARTGTVLLVQPSSAASKHVFSLYLGTTSERDRIRHFKTIIYIEAYLVLQYKHSLHFACFQKTVCLCVTNFELCIKEH